jgi:hypothetical protein
MTLTTDFIKLSVELLLAGAGVLAYLAGMAFLQHLLAGGGHGDE